MIVWSKPLSVLRNQRILLKICLSVLFVVIITTFIFLFSQKDVQAAPSTIGFTARLKNASGSVVADGLYNVNFSLYSAAEGGTPVWTETHRDENGPTEGQDFRARIINGHLGVKLGSRTPFGDSVNWEDNLWLTMNIGGTTQTADLLSIPWDGEMNPRIELTASPYSMNSGMVGGKSANQLVHLGQGKQTDASTGTSSIFIDKTGLAGDLIELQTAGINVFTLDRTGSITLGSASEQSITIADSTDMAGQNLTIAAGSSTADTGNGGDLILSGGSSSGPGSSGGNVAIDAGSGGEQGQGGDISIGSVNASTITIGNTSSQTIINGSLQSGSLDTAEGEAELSIGQDNATSIVLGQDTTIAEGKSLTVGGDTTIQSAAGNSTQALQVQNEAGEAQLTVDTLNSQIRIGSNDTITSLLVLDSKMTEGDPSGVAGAMYYNAASSKFRCYQGAEWVDCITPLPVSKTVDEENETTFDSIATDVEALEFNLAANTKYYYKFMIISDTETTNTGFGLGVTTPTDPLSSHWCSSTTALLGSNQEGSPGWGSYCGVGDVSTTTIGADSPGNIHTTSMEGYIETGQDAGVLKLRAKSENLSEVTVRKGSFGILQIVQ